ncbi:hypothetical protein PspLS_10428 [Pyricularia sp. CBS 133598]|nr:hypothetical protein PspLS_10428 [Pyricularia sp. CBS 133598]
MAKEELEEENRLLEEEGNDEDFVNAAKEQQKKSKRQLSRTALCKIAVRVLAVALAMTLSFIIGASTMASSSGNKAAATACPPHAEHAHSNHQPKEWDMAQVRKMFGKHPKPLVDAKKQPPQMPQGLKSIGKCPPDWRAAKARGCVYDLVLSSWVHPACFNQTMYDRYMSYFEIRNTTFWREPGLVNQVSLAEAAKGEQDILYGEGSIHHLHCAYIAERIVAAVRNRTSGEVPALDTRCWDDAHVNHCILYNGIPLQWEISAPNVTRIYNEPYEVDCLLG